MKKGSTYSLLVEELIDLQFVLDEAECISNDLETDQHFRTYLKKAELSIDMATSLAKCDASIHPENTISAIDYVDKSDLEFLLQTALTHIERINMAYTPDLDSVFDEHLIVALKSVEFYLWYLQQYVNKLR